MHKKFQIKHYFLNLIISFLIIISLPHFINSFVNFPYHFNLSELLTNYQGGFIRRGILGEIILKTYQVFKIDPLIFLSTIFLILYLIQIFFLYKLLEKYRNNLIVLILILVGPVIVLFSIYDIGAYMIKDKFINALILLHAFIAFKTVNDKKSLKSYNLFLIFIIIPLINFNFLLHENQLFFVGIHILLSLYVYDKLTNTFFLKSKYALLYFSIFVSLLFVSLDTPLSLIQKIETIKSSLLENFPTIYERFPMEKEFWSYKELAGNLNLKIGGMMKIFIYFNYTNAINLIVAFILSVGLIFILFNYFLYDKLKEFNNSIKFSYWYLMLPCLIVITVTTDFGRAFNLISTHLLAFFLIFPVNSDAISLKSLTKKNKFLLNSIFVVFIFFYCFFWTMPHAVGWQKISGSNTKYPGGINYRNSNLMTEIVNFSKFTYRFIDTHIIVLPKAEFMK